jgi:hypothetical protein
MEEPGVCRRTHVIPAGRLQRSCIKRKTAGFMASCVALGESLNEAEREFKRADLGVNSPRDKKRYRKFDWLREDARINGIAY